MNTSDSLASLIRSRGFRLTPQRLAILGVLDKAAGHLTPLEVYRRAQESIPGITEATIYRTLNFLTEQGLVLCAHIGSGQFVYESALHEHHHLICRQCGEMREIDHHALESLYQYFYATTGFRVDSVHMTFFGLCPACDKPAAALVG